MNVLIEAKRLHRLGFAVLWLHPKSKRPIGKDWTKGDRHPWLYLHQTYKEGFNVGVRTGQPSRVGPGFLACIDVDIKDPAYKEAALAKLKELIGDAVLPTVSSGSGNGSRHLYCVTKGHFKMLTVAKVKDAWEICVYSDGRQMVLPPSIHPSGRAYAWQVPVVSEIPEISFERWHTVRDVGKSGNGNGRHANGVGVGSLAREASEEISDFTLVQSAVDNLDWLSISKRILEGIKHGTDISDRSGFLLSAASALHSAGLARDEILSVLTDRKLYIGACAYDHAQCDDRRRAAEWVWKYTLRKVTAERSSASVFTPVRGGGGEAGGNRRQLTLEQVEKQTAEIMSEIDWKQNLSKTQHGVLKPTIENVILILANDVDPILVRRNEFAFRDAYGVNAPWGGKANQSLTDDDTAKIKHWLGQKWGFEPHRNVIDDSLIVMACQHSFDPVRDWLDEMPAWDEVPRLDTWLHDHFEAEGDPEYLAQVFRKWMTAMVMRVYRPGAKFDWMPIFEGAQGIGKSSFGRVLVGDRYFLDWLPNLGDKDAALGLQGMWSVEMGELSQFRKNELETIKAFITRTVDKFRPPHGRKLIESPRRCVFFGTTNRSEYLRDDSGNRRFKPVKVGRLDFECLRRDREQLFAEAKVWSKKSTELDLELSGRARVFELEIHQEKMVEDESEIMLDYMLNFLKKSMDPDQPIFDHKKFRISDLFRGEGPLGKWRSDNRNLQFASKMLKRIGGQRRFLKGLPYWKLDGVRGFDGETLTPENEDFV